ncbi:hypothetical protein COU94_00460 [Candidatus Shapirobacteria bacterium CG10_big_fil_rev_8_21_14_0_10_38_8]|nr:MAG: hypothetical protein COU94_00460 [Candidatus Shapirobacteria bacterium CG10_big_fil_rev_8_21_14_0_10_38_8]
MPKKTKQEKIIAELRRKLDTTSLHLEGVHSFDHAQDKSATFQVSHQANQNIPLQNPASHFSLPASPSLPLNTTSIILIKKDLLKTLFLSLLAFGFELVIYWAWNK